MGVFNRSLARVVGISAAAVFALYGLCSRDLTKPIKIKLVNPVENISKDALPGEVFIYGGTYKNRRVVVFEGDSSMRVVISDGKKTEQYTGLVGEQAGLAEKQIIKTAVSFVDGKPFRPKDVASVLTNVKKTCDFEG